MSAPAPFTVMLANASTHGGPRDRALAFGGNVGAGVRHHDDDLDARVDAYLAAGPVAGKEFEYEVVQQLRAIDEDLGSLSRGIADCNIILARTIDRTTRFLNAPSALDDDHAF